MNRRLTLIALAGVCAVLLSACDEDRYLKLIAGEEQPTEAELVQLTEYLASNQPPVQFVAAANVPVVESSSEPSSEAPVVVAYVPPPEPEIVVPPPCDDWVWRGRVYSCTGEYLRDVE